MKLITDIRTARFESFKKHMLNIVSSFDSIDDSVTAAEYLDYREGADTGKAISLRNLSNLEIKYNKINRFNAAVTNYELESFVLVQQIMLVSAIEHATQMSFVEIYEDRIGPSAVFEKEEYRKLEELNLFDAAGAVDAIWPLIYNKFEKITSGKIYRSLFAGKLSGVISGALLGFFAGGVVGMMLGAVIGATVGSSLDSVSSSIQQEKLSNIVDYDLDYDPDYDPDSASTSAVELLTDTDTETTSVVQADIFAQADKLPVMYSESPSKFAFTPVSELDFSGEPCSFTDSEESGDDLTLTW